MARWPALRCDLDIERVFATATARAWSSLSLSHFLTRVLRSRRRSFRPNRGRCSNRLVQRMLTNHTAMRRRLRRCWWCQCINTNRAALVAPCARDLAVTRFKPPTCALNRVRARRGQHEEIRAFCCPNIAVVAQNFGAIKRACSTRRLAKCSDDPIDRRLVEFDRAHGVL